MLALNGLGQHYFFQFPMWSKTNWNLVTGSLFGIQNAFLRLKTQKDQENRLNAMLLSVTQQILNNGKPEKYSVGKSAIDI